MISLKLLAHQLLLGCPSDGNSSFKHLGTKTQDTKQIFLPRELSRIKLAFAAPVVLFVSSHNPGASKTAARLQKGMVGLSVTSEKPTQFGSGKKLRQKVTAGGIGQLVGSGRSLLASAFVVISPMFHRPLRNCACSVSSSMKACGRAGREK